MDINIAWTIQLLYDSDSPDHPYDVNPVAVFVDTGIDYIIESTAKDEDTMNIWNRHCFWMVRRCVISKYYENQVKDINNYIHSIGPDWHFRSIVRLSTNNFHNYFWIGNNW